MSASPSPSDAPSPSDPTSSSAPLHLAVALDGAGGHPAAWREPGARPEAVFTARYWADAVAEAEAGLLDFVTLDDGLALQSTSTDGPDGRTDLVRGRLDAVLTAARIAPLTRHIGLIPSVTTTHTEPFHISKAVATLDHVSRAGPACTSRSPDCRTRSGTSAAGPPRSPARNCTRRPRTTSR